jgi:type II secretory pathway pseudopilin PulG
MNSPASISNNQNGMAIVSVLMVLALITIAGLMATRTSTTEMQISTSDQIHKISFYAAEAARAYVIYNADLYSSINIDPAIPLNFPNDADSTVKQPLAAGSIQSYNGQVAYLNPALPPRGSGYQVGKFKAHVYQMTCIGHGPRSSSTAIEAGFYRIGF